MECYLVTEGVVYNTALETTIHQCDVMFVVLVKLNLF